jgi:hypothetical protein
MSRDRKYHQGFFHPRNPEKYLGDVNNIIYRSSWELKFMQWCDRNPNVLNYASEEIKIKYFDPVKQKMRHYFPDFLIKIKEQTGDIKKYLIEVKPKKQMVEPKQRSRVTKAYLNEFYTFQINKAKWQAAEEFCKDNMLEFKIITESDLGIE